MKSSKSTWKLLTPSWVSNVFAAFAALVLVVGAVILARYQGSQLQQEIFEDRLHASTGSSFHTITANLANNHVLGTAPLFILWAGVGLAVYYFAVSVVSALFGAVQLKKQLNYVNASRDVLLRQALTKLGVRLIAVLAWSLAIKLSITELLPYVLTAAHAASLDLANIGNILIAGLAALVVYAAVQVHVVLMRLIVLKPRVFSRF